MRLILCDDDPIFLKQFSDILLTALGKYEKQIDLVSCQTNMQLFREITSKPTDALFLDIDMPDMDGFTIAKKLSKMQRHPILIFTSNLEHLVFKSFSYQPFWFLRKSHMEEVPEIVQKIVEINQAKKQFYNVNNNGKLMSFAIEEIIYFESNGHYIILHTKNGAERFKERLGDAEEKLRSAYFVRSHVGFLVNCRFIKIIDKTSLLLTNGERLPVSRSKLQETQEGFMNYMRSLRL